MEGLIERVSDITMSPVIRRNIWHGFYRHIFSFSLVCFFTFVTTIIYGQNSIENKLDRVSRMEFVSTVYHELMGKTIDEDTVRKLGVLDPFQDNEMHMDWPITRGIAADAFYRISIQTASTEKLPRAFADIPSYSDMAKVLRVVGGAFMPRNQGKFEEDKLLTPNHFKQALTVLLKRQILKPINSIQIESLPVYKSINTKFSEIKPIRPELGFVSKPHSNDQFIKNTLNRIENVNKLAISNQQMNPQSVSNINEAVVAMNEVRERLKNFGSIVLELTELKIVNSNDEIVMVDTLRQFNKMLADFESRFELCKDQLSRITIVNPKQIRQSDMLNNEIKESLEEIKTLKSRISTRLEESLNQVKIGDY